MLEIFSYISCCQSVPLPHFKIAQLTAKSLITYTNYLVLSKLDIVGLRMTDKYVQKKKLKVLLSIRLYETKQTSDNMETNRGEETQHYYSL